MKRLALGLGIVAAVVAVGARRCGGPSLRIATFNIERFGDDDKVTDLPKLVALLDTLDADVIAVQEIVDPALFARTVEKMRVEGRDYRLSLSRCGGQSRMRVGFIYDAKRVSLSDTVEFPELDPGGEGRCTLGERPGLLGKFTIGDSPFELLAVHLAARGDEEHAMKRRKQWERALQIVAGRRKTSTRAIAILGDTNSTGYLDDRFGERTFLEQKLKEADLVLRTAEVPCSTYWRPDDGDTLAPSMLDHFAATPNFPARGEARVHGYCAETKCRPLDLDESPKERHTVSDHCPVSVGDAR
jgi:endonuclease/exonuclease/phosphatase family metal-dependent hydrolase